MKKITTLLFLALLVAVGAKADAIDYCLCATTQGGVHSDGTSKDLWEDQVTYKPTVAMTSGKQYQFVFKVKATSTCKLSVRVNDGSTTQLVTSSPKTLSNEWKLYRIKITANAAHNEVEFGFGGLDGNLFIDDVAIKDTEVGVNMVTNGDFADNSMTGWTTKTEANGTKIQLVNSGNTPSAGEPYIPDTWEFAKQGNPNFQVYLAFGQSNMEGNAAVEAIDKQNVPERFKMMAAVDYSSPKRTKGNWYTAVPPLCRENTGLTPCDYFGRTMVENLPEEVSVGVINVAVGGAQIRLFMEELKDDYINGEADWFKNICKAYDNDPLARLIEMGKIAQKTGVIKGILLHQGCSDNGSSEWAGKVAKIYKRICYRLGLNPEEVPLLAGETLYANMGGGCSWHNTAALPMLKDAIPNSYVISAKDIPGNGVDAWHFSAAGYRELGKRYATQMLEILNSQTTDVKTVNVDSDNKDVYYNLAGQRLSSKPQHGIYIVNGVKRIAK